MKTKLLIILCFSLLLTGCGDKHGVYIPEISANDIGNTFDGSSVAYAKLHLNEKIYTSSEAYTLPRKEDCVLESSISETGTTVFGNKRMSWSVDRSELYRVTEEAALYTVEGYDPSFLVCVYFTYDNPDFENPHQWIVFKCLNGITLNKGYELFSDRYRLDRVVEVTVKDYQTSAEYTLSVEDVPVQEFISALNEGTFLDPQEDSTPSFRLEEGYLVTFCDALGITARVTIHESGYVTTGLLGQETLILTVDAQACENLLAAIQEN